jgi:hypothetical protein
MWIDGTYPCSHEGNRLTQLVNETRVQDFGEGVVGQHSFSHKIVREDRQYIDYYEKVTTYVGLLLQHARAIQPNATATTFPVVEADESISVFRYLDTASTRAGIGAQSDKLKLGKVAIVGLGGTGSYILDLVAKTPVTEIHLFDGDVFSQHNAFRSPGAISVEDLRTKPNKAVYLAGAYGKMRRNIFANADYIDSKNIERLREMNFIFLSLDNGTSKKEIIAKLHEWGISFVDVGMGIQLTDGALHGMLRTTTSVAGESVDATDRIPLTGDNEHNEYSTNIQIADLNAMNAALAVVKWKKLYGFYADMEEERFSVYNIDGNNINNNSPA